MFPYAITNFRVLNIGNMNKNVFKYIKISHLFICVPYNFLKEKRKIIRCISPQHYYTIFS